MRGAHAARAGPDAMGAVLQRAGHGVVPVAGGGEALTELDIRLRDGTPPDVTLVDAGLPDTASNGAARSGPSAMDPAVRVSPMAA